MYTANKKPFDWHNLKPDGYDEASVFVAKKDIVCRGGIFSKGSKMTLEVYNFSKNEDSTEKAGVDFLVKSVCEETTLKDFLFIENSEEGLDALNSMFELDEDASYQIRVAQEMKHSMLKKADSKSQLYLCLLYLIGMAAIVCIVIAGMRILEAGLGFEPTIGASSSAVFGIIGLVGGLLCIPLYSLYNKAECKIDELEHQYETSVVEILEGTT